MGNGLLGSLSVRFTGDLTGLKNAVVQARATLGTLASTPMGVAVVGLAAVTGAAIAVGVSSVKAAGDFQQSMLKVQAYAGLSKQQTDAMSNSILDMAAKLGQSPKAMADAIYPIISSGYSASESLNILSLSAKTAAASGAQMSTVADMLTTSLKASGAPADQAGHYMDMFNKIVSLGKGEVPAYAATIGKLTLAAGSAKVPFDQMGAALATLTTHGFPSVAQASTSLGNLFTQIGPKVDALAQHAQKLGISFDENKFKTLDLAGKLDYLQKVTGGNQGELLKLLGGSTLALKAFNALTGSAKDFSDNLAQMKNATGATDAAFKAASSGFNASMARMHASMDVLKIKIGQALLPALTDIANKVAPIIIAGADWIEKNHVIENSIGVVKSALGGLVSSIKTAIDITNTIIGVIQAVNKWYKDNEAVIRMASLAITLFYAPALIQAATEAVLSAEKIVASFVAATVESGTEAAVNGAKITVSFVASMIKAGVEGWASGGKIVSGFVASLITTGTESVVSAAKVTASFVASLVKAGVEAAGAGAKIVASFVASLIETGAQAVITGTTMLASLVPAIISVVAESVVAATVAIPSMVVGFGAWAMGAGAAALSTLALTWPILLIGAVIAAVVVGIIVAVRNWGAISKWLTDAWQSTQIWFSGFWKTVQDHFHTAVDWIKNLFGQYWPLIIGLMLGPLGLSMGFVIQYWPQIQSLFRGGMAVIQSFLQAAGGVLYTIFVKPFADAWNFIAGIFSNIRGGIQNIVSLGSNIGSTLHNAGIPGFATGVKNFGGGWAVVGENGPELLKLPSGSDVYPHGVLPTLGSNGATSSGGDQYIYLELDGEVLTQFVANKQSKTVRARMGRRAF